jgi:PAS domain S-box-containing protein
LLQQMLDSTSEALCLADDAGTIVAANRAASELLGVELDVLVQRNVTELARSLPVDLPLIKRALRDGSVNVSMKRPNGPAMLSIRPIVTEGSRRYVVIAVQDLARMAGLIRQIHDDEQAARTRRTFRDGRNDSGTVEVIANSPALLAARTLAARYAQVESPVLIMGETGTGKGLFAKFIHDASSRRTGPLIEVNCASLPPTLLEAELFGYARGAFTGADPRGKQGFVSLADGGTLVLDEIGDLPVALQAKLLRFLEDGEVWPVGSVRPTKPDVRVIAATNRNLADLIRTGDFRSDLFYRLNVLVLYIPPLRNRREDIPLLIEMMMRRLRHRVGKELTLTRDAVDCLLRHDYPGNVRELWNILERSVVTAAGAAIDVSDILLDIIDMPAKSMARTSSVAATLDPAALRTALQFHATQRAAAKALGVSQATVSRRARLYGLA